MNLTRKENPCTIRKSSSLDSKGAYLRTSCIFKFIEIHQQYFRFLISLGWNPWVILLLEGVCIWSDLSGSIRLHRIDIGVKSSVDHILWVNEFVSSSRSKHSCIGSNSWAQEQSNMFDWSSLRYLYTSVYSFISGCTVGDRRLKFF